MLRLANEKGFSPLDVRKGKIGVRLRHPVQSGGAVMVLERMNRAHGGQRNMAYAVIEPGVTYRQLHPACGPADTAFWTDCTDGPADGVIGDALEGIGASALR